LIDLLTEGAFDAFNEDCFWLEFVPTLTALSKTLKKIVETNEKTHHTKIMGALALFF